jgi:phosphopantothenoylcysteine synthetase/decarboxylase
MNILVTAGNTTVPIDRVRCITNIFTGRTGARIASHACEAGHAVTLLTSHPEAVTGAVSGEQWSLVRYQTFEELEHAMREHVCSRGLDVVIHCAAVNDYRSAGVFALAPGTRFRPSDLSWESSQGPPSLIDRSAGKVKSDEPELWLRLVRTPKLIDSIRTDWGFRGVLVKFKLEVGIGDADLLAVAERSRRQSDADLMVANTLEGAGEWAYLGPVHGVYQRIDRRELPSRLLAEVERLHGGRRHG